MTLPKTVEYLPEVLKNRVSCNCVSLPSCKNNRCSCLKAGFTCSNLCGCSEDGCANRNQDDEDKDVSQEIDVQPEAWYLDADVTDTDVANYFIVLIMPK